MPLYVLDENGDPEHTEDTLRWGSFFEDDKNRILKQTHVGDYFVSTVFLGIDHAFMGGKPILWETMIFDTTEDKMTWAVGKEIYQKRYHTKAEALVGHNEALRWLEENGVR